MFQRGDKIGLKLGFAEKLNQSIPGLKLGFLPKEMVRRARRHFRREEEDDEVAEEEKETAAPPKP